MGQAHQTSLKNILHKLFFDKFLVQVKRRPKSAGVLAVLALIYIYLKSTQRNPLKLYYDPSSPLINKII